MADDFVPCEPRVELHIETEEGISGRAGTLIRHEPLADGLGGLS